MIKEFRKGLKQSVDFISKFLQFNFLSALPCVTKSVSQQTINTNELRSKSDFLNIDQCSAFII